MRGQRVQVNRFIPAGAGNTSRRSSGHIYEPVHPRWRGEHALPKLNARVAHGSSPLARGTLVLPGRLRARVRFIPAGAGNTGISKRITFAGPVHPRWRGEHWGRRRQPGDHRGSSPLARGTLGGAERDHVPGRFIPAGAGNTHVSPWRWPHNAVHPRWRGEHENVSVRPLLGSGSSPLARGTPTIRA